MTRESEATDQEAQPQDAADSNNGELVPVESEQNVENQEGEQRQGPQKDSFAQSFFATTKTLIIRALIIYFISSFFRRPAAPTTQSNGSRATAPNSAFNLFANGTAFDLHVYLSESEIFNDFNNSNAKIWAEYGLIYGDWYSGLDGDGSRVWIHKFTPSSNLLNNGSIYLHVYITMNGQSPYASSDKNLHSKDMLVYTKKILNKFKKIRYQKTHNLLTGQTEASEEEIKKAEIMDQEIVSHWHPNLTINLVTDQTNWVQGQVPSPLDEYIEFSSNGKFYKPIIFMNDFWNMQRDYQPLNNTITELELRLTYQPLSLFKWQLFAAHTMRNKWTVQSILGDTSEEDNNDQDTLKEMLLETNPYLLGMTIVVSIFHSVFEFLAFKNDIQFWNNRKSLEGLSVGSVFFNVFQSLIVLLYVLDNETNTLVRISCGIGMAIEVWKINKVVDIKLDRTRRILGFPRLTFKDKSSYVESSTKEYDRLAFKYLSWALFPLLGGYAVYSLMYLEHRGWYTWVLSMLYGFLLTFGFIAMTPQLFINYKLKSVAHMPWRMMSYKFLNTFIDDIFAFIIKMPTLYRLGCFRDDIVFFIFLYQRWIYKIDHKRVNEFGFSGEMEAQLKDEKNKKAIEGTDTVSNKEDKKTQ
ncbi:cleft lip and palate transmembrane protein 1 homolog [Copidosoma floridanum]|uniref:cleft lip and palate transmembrane protein 1 homolog n=1 Tax=Copidosoma floridanum TaxID=29053 RepID=UPI0006C9B104|nr:cleft lip and palate transmembrane protein 1 homolog [Copidosoma floridanum]